MLELERHKVEQLKDICKEEGVSTKGCKVKADYIKEIEKHRAAQQDDPHNKTVESVKANLSQEDSETDVEEEIAESEESPVSVRKQVDNLNRTLSKELSNTGAISKNMAPPIQTPAPTTVQDGQSAILSLKEDIKVMGETLMKEMRNSRTETEEKWSKEREDITREVSELRFDVEDVRAGLITKRDVEAMMKDLKDSQEKARGEFSIATEVMVKKFAEKDNQYQVGFDSMKREVAELSRKMDNLRTYPVMSENRTNSQIMAVVSQFESVQKNIMITGIPEVGDEMEDKERIRQELRDDFTMMGRYARNVIRNVVRVGRRTEGGKPRPVKVTFENLRLREEFMREARDIEIWGAQEWKKWKDAHPDDYMQPHKDKPRFRRYFSDTPNLVRNKVKEIVQVCQLLSVAGPSDMRTPVVCRFPNGDAKLMFCTPRTGGGWISESAGVEAETKAADILRDFSIRKTYKTRSVMAYTGPGAYLPDLKHMPVELRPIFTTNVKTTRLEEVIRARDVLRAAAELDVAVEGVEVTGEGPEEAEEGAEDGTY